MTVLWYAMRSKPNKEDFLARQLESLGMEVFHPRLHVRTVNPRARKVRPYFPGYIFVQVDLEQTGHSTLQWQPGAVGLVSFDGLPASVPESLITAIRKYVNTLSFEHAGSSKGIRRGQIVTIQDGPFIGHEAIFDTHLSGNERVRVLLKLINRQQLPLELPSGQIQLKNTQGTLPANTRY